jgi:hypothetical protein
MGETQVDPIRHHLSSILLVPSRRNLYIYAMRKLILSLLPIQYLQVSPLVELQIFVGASIIPTERHL